MNARSLVALACAAPLFMVGACEENRRSEGEDCLKGSDCLSSICASLKCASESPLMNGEVPPFLPEGGAADADGGDSG
jgi:hypothetical protein